MPRTKDIVAAALTAMLCISPITQPLSAAAEGLVEAAADQSAAATGSETNAERTERADGVNLADTLSSEEPDAIAPDDATAAEALDAEPGDTDATPPPE